MQAALLAGCSKDAQTPMQPVTVNWSGRPEAMPFDLESGSLSQRAQAVRASLRPHNQSLPKHRPLGVKGRASATAVWLKQQSLPKHRPLGVKG